jgi:hypothetical protein
MTIRFIRTLSLALVMLSMTAASFAQIGVAVRFGPPPLPVYEQPYCPGEGYIWTPGYWAYDYDVADYYWVPGTWILAPEAGFLWTPGYWGWGGEGFLFHEGYWGPRVGFYGGINYGFGYFGNGFEGGRWDNGHFFYNRAVTRVNVTVIHNVYNTKIVNRTETRVSFNGGNGGIQARATAEQEAAEHERHMAPVAQQTRHVQEARGDRELRASVNRGKPAVAASAKPGEFKGSDVVRAKKAGGRYDPPKENPRAENQPRDNSPNRPAENGNRPPENGARPTPVHPRDLPAAERPSAPNSGNPKFDKKYQQQQEKQFSKQDQERQKLQQKQEKEDQRLAQQKANDARRQQVEQKHQQQTQHLEQKHEQQQKQMQQRQQPAHPREEEPPKK